MLDVELWGSWAGGHHLTSVVLHAATALVLFFALRALTGRLWPCAFAAAAFALHPLRVESVAWVAERKDVLSGLFFALTLLAYARYARGRFSVARYAWVLLCLALGLAAKPMLVTVPCVLLLLDVWPLRRFARATTRATTGEAAAERPRRPVLEKLPLFALAGASSLVTLFAQQRALSTLEAIPFSLRAENAVLAAATYLREFAVPRGLAVFHPLGAGLSPAAVLLAAVVLLGLSGLALWQRERRPYLLVGWAWYLGMLVPVVGLVQVGSQAHADRYTYLPQIGLALAIGFAGADFARTRVRERIAAGAGVAVLSVWAALSFAQLGYWRDSVALWTHTVECTPESALAWQLLAGGLVHEGRYEEALPCYERAARLRPDHVQVQTGLASTLNRLGRFEEALAAYRRVLALDPDSLLATNNLAWFLATCPDARWRDGPAAVELAERAAAATGHEDPSILDTLSAACARAGDFDAASRWQARAVELAPPAGRAALEQRLARYRQGEAYAEPAR